MRKLLRRAPTLVDVIGRLLDQGRLEIEDSPGAAGLADRQPVMHLVRVDGDDVAGPGLHHAAAARRALRPLVDDADAELLMRMPGETWRVAASTASTPAMTASPHDELAFRHHWLSTSLQPSRHVRYPLALGLGLMLAHPIMIIGIGSDLIDIRRIERSLERYGERFIRRLFTEAERARSERRAQRAASYAKRFAAKEACAKALGTGMSRGVFWKDMGVVNLPGGKPTMRLTNGAARRLAEMLPADHKAAIHLTITDDFPLAQAFVVIEALPAEQRPFSFD